MTVAEVREADAALDIYIEQLNKSKKKGGK